MMEEDHTKVCLIKDKKKEKVHINQDMVKDMKVCGIKIYLKVKVK